MLGPNTLDEFVGFEGYRPPAVRSEIDDFTVTDAQSVLDGDVTPEESRAVANAVRSAVRDRKPLPKRPHGGHRHGTGWAKSEFQPGTTEQNVVDIARCIIDEPNSVVPNKSVPDGFVVTGTPAGQPVAVFVNPVGPGISRWYIAGIYPLSLA